jgi:hypothetical protein
VGCAVLLVAGLVMLLLLQMSLERGAYALQAAQGQARELGEREQSLREQIERLQAPQNLAARATALGMVEAPNPAFLRASDGKVLGVPAPGVARPSPTVKKPSVKAARPAASTPATKAARPSAKGSAGAAPKASGTQTPKASPKPRPTATP